MQPSVKVLANEGTPFPFVSTAPPPANIFGWLAYSHIKAYFSIAKNRDLQMKSIYEPTVVMYRYELALTMNGLGKSKVKLLAHQ